MNAESATDVQGRWATAACERNCDCSVWDKDPAAYEAQGYPLGYCGFCDRCGVPGHTRHFPGPVPYTGSWCYRCYRIVKWTWPFRTLAGWLMLFVVLAITYAVGSPFFSAIARVLR